MRSITLGFALATGAIGALSAQASVDKLASPAAALDDAAIFALLDKANTAEIELGELAARLGQSNDVRELGKTFAAAHTTARQKARDLAVKVGITPAMPDMKHPADSMGKDHARGYEASLNKLKGLKGPEFDVAFIAREIEHHGKMIEAVENKFLPAVQNDELRTLLEELKPSLQSHLDQARALEKRLALGS